jgi:hypothetical protein
MAALPSKRSGSGSTFKTALDTADHTLIMVCFLLDTDSFADLEQSALWH